MKNQPGIRLTALAAVCLIYAGCARAQSISRKSGGYDVSTGKIAAQVRVEASRWKGVTLLDAAAGRSVTLPEAFVLKMQDGTVVESSQLTMRGGLAESGSARPGDGRSLSAEFVGGGAAPRFAGVVRWRLTAKPQAGYLRQFLTIAAGPSDLPIAQVLLLDFRDPGAIVDGSVKGSPVVDASMFFGFEHPLSWAQVDGGQVTAGITRQLPLRAGQSVTYSSVAGVASPGQMRRDFLAYLEAERPRPYSPFLHYNSWFDIGYQNRYSEADAIDRVEAYGNELVRKRGVVLSSFLFDDGWDDPHTLWGFDSGFPHGFANVAEKAKEINAGIGVWLSPWGGYAEQKKERIAYGTAHGYEIFRGGYALSGPRYYRAFEQVCLEMIQRYGVNQFKFDGTGNADRVFPGSAFDSDFDAAIHLIERIRQAKSAIFINLTTGTHPSPFWVYYADSIWRGGDDSSFAGVGTWRQRWITYRDEQVYRNIVKRAPLYPLNSLMLHGMIFAKQAKNLNVASDEDFADEVHSYFGTGTQLQEMYITPSLMSPAKWDTLAAAARWSRQKSPILKDTHWVGGDPGNLEVYGWAAWSPQGWIVTLRNPSSEDRSFSLHLEKALELPPGAAKSYAAHDPFAKSAPPQQFSPGVPAAIHLKPFEVRTLEWDRSG